MSTTEMCAKRRDWQLVRMIAWRLKMSDAVVERLLKGMRSIHPRTVRQFFALANQHMRWELNDFGVVEGGG